MTETIDATSTALDFPAPLVASSAPSTASLLPPPTFEKPAMLLPPIPAPAPVAAPAPIPAPAPVVAPVPASQVSPIAAAPLAENVPAEPAAMIAGPSAIFSTDAALMPADLAVPVIPKNAPVAPSPTAATAAAAGGSAFDVEEFLGAQGSLQKGKAKKKPKRRWFVRLLLVGLLGAGGWYGKQHGPELYEQYVNKNTEALPAETTAPLAFPNVTSAAAPIRTAEFVLVGLAGTPSATYRVTTDFETDVSQVDITREGAPDLQILTYGSDAMIRRSDGEQWYILDRGQFPLDGRLERADWVRMIEELLPNDVRGRAAIDQATESTIAGVPTRHLLLTVDPALLGTVPLEPIVAPTDVASEAATPTPPSDVPLDAAAAIPADEALAAGSVAADGTIQLEVWIDGQGLVRQVTGAPQLGADTITIVSTSAEAWIPDYPAPDEIAPLTASALVDLGL